MPNIHEMETGRAVRIADWADEHESQIDTALRAMVNFWETLDNGLPPDYAKAQAQSWQRILDGLHKVMEES